MESKKHLIVGLPHYGDFSGEFLDSMLFLKTGWKGDFTYLREKSCYIHNARNKIFNAAKCLNADWLLFIDSDTSNFNITDVEKLMNLNVDIASGVYYQKIPPYRPNVYAFTNGKEGVHMNYYHIPETPFKCDSVGAGFLLISKKVLQEYDYKKYGKPFNYILREDNNGGDMIGEDTTFCLRMKEAGYEVWCDPSIDLGHIGSYIYGKENFLRYKEILKTVNTEWTTKEEQGYLKSISFGKVVAEIGCWKGATTKELLSVANGVYAVDHFKGSETDESGTIVKAQDIYEEFCKNVGENPRLEVLKMSSKEASYMIDDESLDVVFIDADHSYKGVSEDITLWLPKIKKGGIICGHDYSTGFLEVIQAVNERFKDIELHGTIWSKQV